jgi:hypothetical protein
MKKETSQTIVNRLTSECISEITPALIIAGKGSIAYSPSRKAEKSKLIESEDFHNRLKILARSIIVVHPFGAVVIVWFMSCFIFTMVARICFVCHFYISYLTLTFKQRSRK